MKNHIGVSKTEVLKLLRKISIDAVVETIENLAFMEVIPENVLTPYDENLERLRAAILINEPFTGELRLIFTKQLIRRMIANACQSSDGILPEVCNNIKSTSASDISDKMLEDMLAELVNIIAGRIMKALIPEKLDFKIGLPEIGEDIFLETDGASLCLEFISEGSPFWMVAFGDGFLNADFHLAS